MKRRTKVLIGFAAGVVAASCGSAQSGRYAVTGMGTAPLMGDEGTMILYDGEPISSTRESSAGAMRLLSVVIVTPGASGGGSSGTGGSGGEIAEFKQTIGVGSGGVAVEGSWNKRTDVVSVEGFDFDRAKGNVIVVVKPLGGQAQVWQLEGYVGRWRNKDLLQHVKDRLPDVKAVQGVTSS